MRNEMNIEQNLFFKTWHFILSSLKNSFAFHFITINLIAANYGNSMFAERERERVLGFLI
jgi:hypothetical protein